MPEAQIGVLIDYENVGLLSINTLFDQLSDLGRIIVKRAYADWSKAANKGDEMLQLGIEARHYFRAAGSSKNASDISLAIDAIDLMYRSPVDTFVVVSSDTDFVPLVSTLRAAGKTVIGAGRRDVVAPGLVRSCDRYIFLGEEKPIAVDHTAFKREVGSLLTRAIEASIDDQGQVVAAKLHNTMLRMDPSFDFRAFGHRTFTQFLSSSTLVKLNRPRGFGDVLVELASGSNHKDKPVAETEDLGWDHKIDAAWSVIPGDNISGSKAAAEAAKVLGTSKLSDSKFKNLQGLLDASQLLRDWWYQTGNKLFPKSGPGKDSH